MTPLKRYERSNGLIGRLPQNRMAPLPPLRYNHRLTPQENSGLLPPNGMPRLTPLGYDPEDEEEDPATLPNR